MAIGDIWNKSIQELVDFTDWISQASPGSFANAALFEDSFGSHIYDILQYLKGGTAVASDATPDVTGWRIVRIPNTVSLTSFVGIVDKQELIVLSLASDGPVNIVHDGTNIKLPAPTTIPVELNQYDHAIFEVVGSLCVYRSHLNF